jgi:hypothetical protein
LASSLSGASISYVDRADQPAVGGEPFTAAPYLNADNNVLRYVLIWADGAGLSHEFPSEVTLRGAAYTNLNATNGGDSGTALDIGGVSAPPGGC